MSYGIGLYGTTPYGGSPLPSEPGAETITNYLTMSSQLTAAHISILGDTLSMTDSALATLYATTVIETFGLTDLTTPEARYFYTALEAIQISGAQVVVLNSTLAEGFLVSGQLTADIYRLIALMDAVAMTDGVLTAETLLFAEALAVHAVQTLVVQQTITDTAEIADLLTQQVSAYVELIESVVAQAVLTGLAVMTVLLNDDMAVSDAAQATASYQELIADGLGFSVSLVIDGIPFIGMTMNALSRGVSEYTNYNFNSLANFNGALYGANDAGMFRLEGDDDAGTPIDAYARTALVRMADGRQARVDCAYLGYRSDGSLQMKVVTSGAQGQKVAYVYDMVQVTAESVRPNRIKFGRGMKAAYYAFQISNTNGADFAIDVIEIHPLPLDRRVP